MCSSCTRFRKKLRLNLCDKQKILLKLFILSYKLLSCEWKIVFRTCTFQGNVSLCLTLRTILPDVYNHNQHVLFIELWWTYPKVRGSECTLCVLYLFEEFACKSFCVLYPRLSWILLFIIEFLLYGNDCSLITYRIHIIWLTWETWWERLSLFDWMLSDS